MSDSESIPLCVDLDGTLVKLDTLHQALFLLLRRDPVSMLKIPSWLRKGKAHLKDQVMRRVELNAPDLPYNTKLLNWLKQEHSKGRKLILATASNYRTANAVAEHLGIFDDVLASNEETNLRHTRKLDAIQKRFPTFAYAGNDFADFPIWDAAEEVILANPSKAAKKEYAIRADHIFMEQRPIGQMFIKAMRPQQWLKNLLIFSPMLLAHRFTDLRTLLYTTIAFFSFSFAASSIYVLNDLFDLSADQHHPRKRKRPFASGDLPISAGIMLTPLLVLMSLGLCAFLPPPFLITLLVYYAITTAYSWRVKQMPIADVLTLAILYSMRIVAGSMATGTAVSGWFIEFAIFLFLSLALVKRTSELKDMKDSGAENDSHRERGYRVDDLPLLLGFGTAAGYISVFVFTMYLGSDKVAELYTYPSLLWIFCPLLLYWITRIWHLAWRGKWMTIRWLLPPAIHRPMSLAPLAWPLCFTQSKKIEGKNMSKPAVDLIIVGSIGIDTIETPAEKREEILGGSVSYACAAASFFSHTGMVGVVGTDFPQEFRDTWSTMNIDLAGLQTVEGKTFRWGGVYHDNMDNRDTLFTDLAYLKPFHPSCRKTIKKPRSYFSATFTRLFNCMFSNRSKTPNLY